MEYAVQSFIAALPSVACLVVAWLALSSVLRVLCAVLFPFTALLVICLTSFKWSGLRLFIVTAARSSLHRRQTAGFAYGMQITHTKPRRLNKP